MERKYIIGIIIIIAAAVAYYLYRNKSKYNCTHRYLNGWKRHANMQLVDKDDNSLYNTRVSIVTKGLVRDIMSDTSGSITMPRRFIGKRVDVHAHLYSHPGQRPRVITAKGVLVYHKNKIILK